MRLLVVLVLVVLGCRAPAAQRAPVGLAYRSEGDALRYVGSGDYLSYPPPAELGHATVRRKVGRSAIDDGRGAVFNVHPGDLLYLDERHVRVPGPAFVTLQHTDDGLRVAIGDREVARGVQRVVLRESGRVPRSAKPPTDSYEGLEALAVFAAHVLDAYYR